MEPTTVNPANASPKIGRFRRGWELTKSSWGVLKLDKELAILPVVSMVVSVVACVGIAIGLMALAVGVLKIFGVHNFATNSPWPLLPLALCLAFTLSIVGNFFSAAIIYGATERFRGGDPTLRSSLAGAWHKLGPLAAFSLMMATVGLALQVLENRLPIAGKIIAWLGGLAWSIATMLAVPVIVLSEDNVRPFAAVKQSSKTIRDVWGNGGVAAQFGISLVGVLTIFGYVGFWILLGVLTSSVAMPNALFATTLAVAVLGFFLLLAVFGALTSIAKAALYHYATTGQAPELFNQQLLQASMTQKKARRIFA